MRSCCRRAVSTGVRHDEGLRRCLQRHAQYSRAGLRPGVAGVSAYLAREQSAGRAVGEQTLVAIAVGAKIDFGRLGYVAGHRSSAVEALCLALT